MPLWEIEYDRQVSNYFFDNDPYTFPLLARIEELRITPNAVPPEGCTPLPGEPGSFMWLVLGHVVVYEKIGTTRLIVWAVKPLSEPKSILPRPGLGR
jgi:hypothetical protein